MQKILPTLALLTAVSTAVSTAGADTLPFELSITGAGIDLRENLELSDLGEGKTAHQLSFTDADGKAYGFELKYKALPDNRSFPSNLDITLKDGDGNKLGYLFFAINGVSFLQQMGEFGLIVDVSGEPVTVNFAFDADKQGGLKVADLEDERFVQDTLMPKHGFQMIRPVLLPQTEPGVRSQSYALDAHPYEVNYTLKDLDRGLVQLQFNLLRTGGEQPQLLERIYYNADSLETLREGMFAGKYFDAEAGTFKLVYYPVMGQTTPAR